jgi:predicted CoA-binding protein
MKVMVYGASTNPERYAYKATELLLAHRHELVLVGNKTGEVLGIPILQGHPELIGVDTMTLYVGPQNQGELLEYARRIKPRRIIFNPGTENPELYTELEKAGIQVEEACTLVLLHTGQFD